MPRQARLILPGIPHHVTQRGNRRQEVFHSEEDRLTFLGLMSLYFTKFEVELLAYCLMTNHVHFVAIPHSINSFHLAFKSIFRRYAAIKNLHMGWSGHLWQERYFSSAIGDQYFMTTIRYVEQNPVRARMAALAEGYRWSSAPAHCKLIEDPLLCGSSVWQNRIESIQDWSSHLRSEESTDTLTKIRLTFTKGLPLVSEEMLKELEKTTGRCLKIRGTGRPRACASG